VGYTKRVTNPERILPLLWRHSATRPPATTGRPAKLTLDVVVSTAVRLADADGLEAASMARVATALGVGTMTLYSYVPSRAELVDLMVDEVLTGLALPAPGEARPGSWPEQIRLYADRTHAMYAAHPWLTGVSTQRPPIGPGMLAEREYVLSAVSDIGLPVDLVNTAAVTIQAFVTSAARAAAESAQLRRATGQSNDAWWQQRNELWETWFDVERHPAMTALWNAGGFGRGTDEQMADAYDYGLRLLLDGIARDAGR
jgi:AcrR family transcriptional regulator